jgi:hypothetical protein
MSTHCSTPFRSIVSREAILPGIGFPSASTIGGVDVGWSGQYKNLKYDTTPRAITTTTMPKITIFLFFIYFSFKRDGRAPALST